MSCRGAWGLLAWGLLARVLRVCLGVWVLLSRRLLAWVPRAWRRAEGAAPC